MVFDFSIWFAIVPAIIIFIYGIDHFSKEIQKAAGSQFQHILRWATKGTFRATLLGAFITALIQASAATTIIAIGLVNAGTITFTQSLGIIFGANIGTTVTSQLVAFNLMQFAPIVIILGFILSLLKTKYKVFGKPIFYFGLVLFSLNLISIAVEPLKTDAQLLSILAQTSIIPIGILAGFIITNLFQSSSVTTGLVVILAQNELLGLNEAIPILLGANIGTTILSIIVSLRMDTFAKRAALSHFLFNFLGVLITIPFIGLIIFGVDFIGGTNAQQVANAHLIFNVATTIILLIFIKQFQWVIEKLIPTKEEEIVLRTKNLENIKNKSNTEIFKAVEKELKNGFDSLINSFNESIILLLSEKTSESKISKLNALNNYIHDEIQNVLTFASKKSKNKKDSEKIILLARTSALTQQISNIIKKISDLTIYIKESELEFNKNAKKDLEECTSKLNNNVILIKDNFPNFEKEVSIEMAKNSNNIRNILNKSFEEYLLRLSKGTATTGSVFTEQLALIQDTDSKIREIRKLCQNEFINKKKVSN